MALELSVVAPPVVGPVTVIVFCSKVFDSLILFNLKLSNVLRNVKYSILTFLLTFLLTIFSDTWLTIKTGLFSEMSSFITDFNPSSVFITTL